MFFCELLCVCGVHFQLYFTLLRCIYLVFIVTMRSLQYISSPAGCAACPDLVFAYEYETARLGMLCSKLSSLS